MNRADCDIYRLDNANLSEHVVNIIRNTECNIVSYCIHCRVGKYDTCFQTLKMKHEMKRGLLTVYVQRIYL